VTMGGGGDGDQGDDQIWPPHALSSPSSIGGVAPDAGLDLSDGREGGGPHRCLPWPRARVVLVAASSDGKERGREGDDGGG
jgi:hypothetical protein